MLHRLGHRRLGDGVEGDALHVLGQRLAVAEHFLHVPRNRFALAVRVGCEDQAVGGLGEIGDRLQLLGLVGVIFPFHREPVLGIDRAVLGRQVADMAVGGEDAVIAAQIFLDGLRLGGRFDDDKLHGVIEVLTCTREGGGVWGGSSSGAEAALLGGVSPYPPFSPSRKWGKRPGEDEAECARWPDPKRWRRFSSRAFLSAWRSRQPRSRSSRRNRTGRRCARPLPRPWRFRGSRCRPTPARSTRCSASATGPGSPRGSIPRVARHRLCST
ncbi:hypothetical protein D9M73_126670 [compost metagenome]